MDHLQRPDDLQQQLMMTLNLTQECFIFLHRCQNRHTKVRFYCSNLFFFYHLKALLFFYPSVWLISTINSFFNRVKNKLRFLNAGLFPECSCSLYFHFAVPSVIHFRPLYLKAWLCSKFEKGFLASLTALQLVRFWKAVNFTGLNHF